MRVGFIGLGIMGRPMARNLLKAGYELWVNSRSRGPVDELAACGARVLDGRTLNSVMELDVVTNFHVGRVLSIRLELLEALRRK